MFREALNQIEALKKKDHKNEKIMLDQAQVLFLCGEIHLDKEMFIEAHEYFEKSLQIK